MVLQADLDNALIEVLRQHLELIVKQLFIFWVQVNGLSLVEELYVLNNNFFDGLIQILGPLINCPDPQLVLQALSVRPYIDQVLKVLVSQGVHAIEVRVSPLLLRFDLLLLGPLSFLGLLIKGLVYVVAQFVG